MTKWMLVLACGWLSSAGLTAALVNFDDLPHASGPVPSGYADKRWSHAKRPDEFFVYKDLQAPGDSISHGVVSGTKAVYNNLGKEAQIVAAGGGLFNLESGYFTSMTDEAVTIDVTGFRNGCEIYSTSIPASKTSPAFFAFHFSDVDRVTFYAYNTSGSKMFILDDLQITPVPEPLHLGWGCGLAVAGFILAHSRKDQKPSGCTQIPCVGAPMARNTRPFFSTPAVSHQRHDSV